MPGTFAVLGKPLASLIDACALVKVSAPSTLKRGQYLRVKADGDHRGARSGAIREITVYGDKGEVWQGATVFNWRLGVKARYLEGWSESKRLSRAEQARIREQFAAAEAEEERRRQEVFAAASTLAAELFEISEIGDVAAEMEHCDHPYLAAKGLAGARMHVREISRDVAQQVIEAYPLPGYEEPQVLPLSARRLIVLPLSKGGRLRSLQFITEDGTKRMLRGGEKRGTYWIHEPGRDIGIVGVAEGLATALSVEALYPAIPCAVAVDAGNLLPAAESILRDRPGTQLVFFADNDPPRQYGSSVINRGRAAAIEAVRNLPDTSIHRSKSAPTGIVLPVFGDGDLELFRQIKKDGEAFPTDFNDALALRRVRKRRDTP